MGVQLLEENSNREPGARSKMMNKGANEKLRNPKTFRTGGNKNKITRFLNKFEIESTVKESSLELGDNLTRQESVRVTK